MGQAVILTHPLLQHKISLLRNKSTDTGVFRRTVTEIAMLLGYEAYRDLETESVSVTTPLTTAEVPMLAGQPPVLVPILRAGLGMVEGMSALLPEVSVGHIGLYRDEETFEPHTYFCKLPPNLSERQVIVLDPMLATGGSAVQAIDALKEKGCKRIRFVSIIAAPEGLQTLQQAHPDIDILVGCLDSHLNERAYIVPGLGDAGDRLFGTIIP